MARIVFFAVTLLDWLSRSSKVVILFFIQMTQAEEELQRNHSHHLREVIAGGAQFATTKPLTARQQVRAHSTDVTSFQELCVTPLPQPAEDTIDSEDGGGNNEGILHFDRA